LTSGSKQTNSGGTVVVAGSVTTAVVIGSKVVVGEPLTLGAVVVAVVGAG
jgi:hypothetical protein